MEREFTRIYECMISSNKILDGEYYVIHADHLHDFLMAIEYYFDEDKKIKKLDLNGYNDISTGIKEDWLSSEDVIIVKINEIIDKLNKMENK